MNLLDKPQKSKKIKLLELNLEERSIITRLIIIDPSRKIRELVRNKTYDIQDLEKFFRIDECISSLL